MNGEKPIRIAMWSGPRNISTAMMRSWGNRADTVVIDEPLYAYYLEQTGADHPGAEEVIATGETDWRKIVARLTSDPANGASIVYQKQMTHHLLAELERDWIFGLTNCFLIRDPGDVILSYLKKNHDPVTEELGFVQQAALFDALRERTSAIPPVIEARDVLADPRRILNLLCDALGVAFDDAMLSWPPGRRATDGIWAKYWYDEVERSTSFAPPRAEVAALPARLQEVYEECRGPYEALYHHRIH